MGIARYEKRLLAYLFDEVLACLFGVGIAILMYHFEVLGESIFLIAVLSCVFAYLVYVFLCTLVSALSGGMTFGFMVAGIKAIHSDGSPFTLRDAFIRAVTKGLLPAVLANAVYMLAVHSQRSIFDRLSDTLVIDKRRR